MKKSPAIGSDIPSDFPYFRSSSPVYRDYLKQCGLNIIDHQGQFWWMKDFKLFQIAKFERTDFEPTKELVQRSGFKHGLLLWIPGKTSNVPAPWRTLWVPGSHFTSTGITRVVPEYTQLWNERARRARKRFLSAVETDGLVLRHVGQGEFIEAFKKVSVTHSFKKDYISYYTKMSNIWDGAVRSYVVYTKDGAPLAGLAVHDSGNTSIHLVAFTSRESKGSQVGTGLVDAWFSDSLQKGIKYIHFDHLRDAHMTRDQQGYTDFKMNFIETPIWYPKCYFQIW